jgi:acetyl esterase/lipase
MTVHLRFRRLVCFFAVSAGLGGEALAQVPVEGQAPPVKVEVQAPPTVRTRPQVRVRRGTPSGNSDLLDANVLPGAKAAAIVQRDVVFGTGGPSPLSLDVYRPKSIPAEPAPLVVHIHGGGWRAGAKSFGAFFPETTDDLLTRGYVVASIEYRLAPAAKWPDFIEDCKCAIRHLRAEAKTYGIDPERVGVYGTSAGGHLAALLGTTDAESKLEGKGGHGDQSSRVQAVVDLWGPADLTLGGRRREGDQGPFGDADMRKAASPVTYVTKDDPPFLLIHGDADQVVPVAQSKLMHERLTAAGVPSTLVVVERGNHGCGNDGIKPTKPELVRQIGDFFDKHLRK